MTIRITHVVPTLGRGGAERQLVDLVLNTEPGSFEHRVCYLRPPDGFARQLTEAGTDVVDLGVRGSIPWFHAATRLSSLLKAAPPDVLHTWLYDANLSARLASLAVPRIPTVTSLQFTDYEPGSIRGNGWPAWKVGLLRRLDAASARWSKPSFVACSAHVKQSAVRYLGVKEASVRVIYNSVDPRRLVSRADDGRALRRSLAIPADGVLFLNVGRLDPQKGQRYLLSAFQKLAETSPRAYLAVAGDGPMKKELTQLASELKVSERCRFLGSRDDIQTCLAMADVFVFPSVSEGFGIALMEAMYKGLPCIASRLGAICELVEDGKSGLLVTPESAVALFEAMSTLYRDAALRARLGARSEEEAKSRFQVRATMPQWEALYRELAQRD